jgi:Putative peptidoglycan binding domain
VRMRALTATALLGLAGCHATVEAKRPRMPSAAQLTPKSDPGRPKLAVSPAQTLTPQGLGKLAQALRAKGHMAASGEPTREQVATGLKAFQTEAKLAATGYPDTETLHRLGLTPEDL